MNRRTVYFLAVVLSAFGAQPISAQTAADSAGIRAAAMDYIIASDWVDYLELAKWNGRWVIVNVLWELKPKTP